MHKGLATALAALLFAAVAHAETAPEFSQLDADGDGVISQEEASAKPEMSEQLAKADVNADGKIDRAEYARATGAEG